MAAAILHYQALIVKRCAADILSSVLETSFAGVGRKNLAQSCEDFLHTLG
jgi:hypothetical protein